MRLNVHVTGMRECKCVAMDGIPLELDQLRTFLIHLVSSPKNRLIQLVIETFSQTEPGIPSVCSELQLKSQESRTDTQIVSSAGSLTTVQLNTLELCQCHH